MCIRDRYPVKEKIVVAPDILEKYLGVRRFRYGLAEEQDQIGFARDPVGEVASCEALDLGAFATIKIDHTIAEMGEDGQVEIAFEIGTGDEPAEQTRQRDLHSTGLPERLCEDEGLSLIHI